MLAVSYCSFKNVNSLIPDWGHSEAYGWLGSVELGLGNRESAKVCFEKALEIGPDNGWVRYHLMPKIE